MSFQFEPATTGFAALADLRHAMEQLRTQRDEWARKCGIALAERDFARAERDTARAANAGISP